MITRVALICATFIGVLSATVDDTTSCTINGGEGCIAASEVEVEQVETQEMSGSQVELLQKKLQASELTDVATTEETKEDAAAPMAPATNATVSADSDQLSKDDAMNKPAIPLDAISPSLVSWDDNGKACLMCGGPLPGRSNKEYKTRSDCGNSTTAQGPTVGVLQKPVSGFATVASDGTTATNGFCELNFERSCADAIYNEDYSYWAKSLDLAQDALKTNNQWDARYCHLNGWLSKEVVALQNNFTGMHAMAKDLCDTKYSKYPLNSLTFRDMMARSRYNDPAAPTLVEAEMLAAWNCAMGDLGCDMALCAYSFCNKGDGKFNLYGECEGWDPVQGMPQ